MSITAAISSNAAESPDAISIVFEEHRISREDLDREVSRIASFISGLIPDGNAVAIHLPTSPALALIFLGVVRSGREAQVFDFDFPLQTIEAILSELNPPLMFSSGADIAYSDTIEIADPFAPMDQLASTIGAGIVAGEMKHPDAAAPFFVGFTSGSTGVPKGYRRHHHSWTESFKHDALEFGLTERDVILAPGTLSHSLFLYALVHGLNVGARVVLCRRFKPDWVLQLAEDEQATVLYGVPTQLQLLITSFNRPPCRSVRWVFSSGAKFPGDEVFRLNACFPSATFAEFYGASETSFISVAKPDENCPTGSVGRAFSGVKLTIRDAEGDLLPPNAAGYVFVESPFLFMDYACGTASDLMRRGEAISVGDIGFLDDAGFLHLVGRAGRKIITSGKNVFPEEIERALERHPSIESAAVLGVPDTTRGERLIALVRLRVGKPACSSQLVIHLRLSLPLYKIPRVYADVQDWSRTPSGKTDFPQLQRRWGSGEFKERLL